MTHPKAGVAAFFGLLEFPAAWIVFIAVISVDVLLDFLVPRLIFPSLLVILTPFFFLIYARFLFRSSDIRRRLTDRAGAALNFFSLFAESLFLYKSAAYALSFLIYFLCMLNDPLIDAPLQHIDQVLGFDWLSWFNRLDHLGWLNYSNILCKAYASLLYQCLFLVGFFSFFVNRERLQETFWILFISLLVTAVISGFLPALGPVYFYKLESVFNPFNADLVRSFADVVRLRSGQGLDLSQGMHGTITFPSFHAACAVIYAHAFRRSGVTGYAMFLLNAVMLVSIPVFGGHYLADVIAGLFVAIASIVIVRNWPLRKPQI